MAAVAAVLVAGCSSGAPSPGVSPAPSTGATEPGPAAAQFDWGTPIAGASDEFDRDGAPSAEWNQAGECWAGNGDNGKRCASHTTVHDGMLSETGDADAVTGWLAGNQTARRGRWEVRARIVPTGGSGTPYHPVIALIPGDDADYHCGATDMDFAESDVGGETNAFWHNVPNVQRHSRLQIDQSQWHSYGVEIADDHVTWFVDGRVITTDTDPAVVPDVPYRLNIELDANTPSGLAPARLDVDWARSYPLPDGEPVPPGPAPERQTYSSAC